MDRGLLSEEIWAVFAPFVIEQGPKRGRLPAGHRRMLDAVFWIAHGLVLAGPGGRTQAMGVGLQAVSALDPLGSLGRAAGGVRRQWGRA